MQISISRWQIWAVAIAASAGFTGSLSAAQPRTANGNPVVRTTHQQPAENAPSVMAPTKRPAPPTPPTAPGRAQRSVAPPPVAEGEIVDEGLVMEEAGPGDAHGRGMFGPGYESPGFNDMDFNEGCLGGNCRPCSTGPLWIRAEYILWWRSGQQLPALVTTAPDGTPLATAGEIGNPATSTLFGGQREDYPVRPGGRVEAGMWLDQCECFGIGGRFYWLGDAERSYTASSTGSPILAIPFTEGANGDVDARVIAFPGTFNGNLNFTQTSEVFGGDAYARMQWCRTDWGRIDLLGGYQFARINEGLTLDSTVADTGGASNRLVDNFRTYNEFHGGMLGVNAHIDHCWYYVDILGKVGLGNMNEQVTISGQSISTVGSTVSTTNGGLFAQPTNIGTHTRSEFVAIPELNATLGFHLTNCVDLNFGYTLIVFTGVARPGDAIDTTVNTSQIGGTLSGPSRPAFAFSDSDLVLHGLSMGVTVKF